MKAIRHAKAVALLATFSVFSIFMFLPVNADAQVTATFGSGTDVPGPANYRATAVPVGCDKIYVLGGHLNLQAVLLYNYSSDAWTTVATTIPTGVTNTQAVENNGIIYLPGGQNSISECIDPLQAYDISGNTWLAGLAALPNNNCGGMTGVSGGKLYLLGGYDENGTYNHDTWSYNFSTDEWTSTGLAGISYDNSYGLTITIGQYIYIIGGSDSSGAVAKFGRYDTVANTWTSGPDMPEARMSPFGAHYGEYLYIGFGGGNGGGWWGPWSTVIRYKLSDWPGGSWALVATTNTPAAAVVTPASTCLIDKIYFAGGFDGSSNVSDFQYLTDTGLACHQQAPEIVTQPQDVSIRSGHNATLVVVGQWSGILNYQWQESPDGVTGWADIAGATSASYTTPAMTVSKYFRVNMSNGCGAVVSDSAEVIVAGDPVTWIVTSTDDSGDGTLRDAVADALAGDTISFALPSGSTITLSSPIALSKDLTIEGPGAPLLSIAGNGTEGVRVFTITAGNINLSNVTVKDGKVAPGFSQPTTAGGGIYVGDGAGLTIEDCAFSNNEAGMGGAIYSRGTLIVERTFFDGNRAKKTGTANGGGGGGIQIAGAVTATIEDCDFNMNTSETGGGGILAGHESGMAPTVSVTGSTFRDNIANGNTGTIGTGGGYQNHSNAVSTLVNCTFSGNRAEGASDDGGGGLILYSGTVTLNNVTFTGNHAATNDAYIAAGNAGSGGGGIAVSAGPAVKTIHVKNTIMGGNTSDATDRSDVSGAFASQGYNLVGDGDGSTGWDMATGDIVGTHGVPVDAKLGTLGSYGGLTLTVPLLIGSPAINAGNPTPGSCATTDQRDVPRPQLVQCSIGALESGATSSVVASSKNPSTVGEEITLMATVSSKENLGVPTGTVTFKDGADSLGTGILSGGTTTFSTSSLAVGDRSITAVYGGDSADFGTSTSPAIVQTVNAVVIDGGTDAGNTDAGVDGGGDTDASISDAGADGGGNTDAGHSDAGIDAGTDGGTDGGQGGGSKGCSCSAVNL